MTKQQREKYIKETFSGTQVGVLVEHFTDKVKLVGEQHGSLNKKIDELGQELKKEIGGFRSEMYEFRDEMHEFRAETKENFKLVMDYLSRIEDDFMDLRSKIEKMDKENVSLKEFNWLKEKVLEIENRLDRYKKRQSNFSSKA